MGYEKRYKVLAYERVSTKNEDQANSLVNQGLLREKFLKRHPEMMLIQEPFSEKVSGKSDRRPEYQKMVKRLKEGDIDYLLIKDLKRLCRSNEVSSQLRHMCQRYSFKLILTSTNQVYDPNDEEYRLMFGFESLINEEVVYRQSNYARIAHQQKVEEKRLNANNVTFGFWWNYEKNDMAIDEREAHILKMLFEMMVYRNIGVQEISKILALEYGVTGKFSKKLVSGNSLRRWLRDPVCMGKFYINKRGTILEVGIGAKSKSYQKNKEEWVMIDRPDLQIIPTELFELAQKIMDENTHIYAEDKNGVKQSRFKGTHLFSAKVYCGKCGYSLLHYYTNRNKTISAYKDSYRLKAKSPEMLECTNKEYSRIHEVTLSKIALSAINGLIENNEECFDILMEVLTSSINGKSQDNIRQVVLEEQIMNKEKEAEKIMELFIEASQAMREALGIKYECLIDEIAKLKDKQDMLVTVKEESADYKDRLSELKETLKSFHKIEKLDRNIIENFIHKIIINDDGKLDIYLKTDTIQAYEIDAWEKAKEFQSRSETPKISYIYAIRELQDSVVKMVHEGMTAL